MSCNYDKPQPNPVVLFQSKIFRFDRMKTVVAGDLICVLCAAFVKGIAFCIVYSVTPEQTHEIEMCHVFLLRNKLCSCLSAAFSKIESNVNKYLKLGRYSCMNPPLAVT